MKITRRRCLAALPSLGLLAAAGPARGADPSSFSEAERLLFASSHFLKLGGAAQLEYSYRLRGSLQDEADDQAVVMVGAQAPGGGRDVRVVFLSGPRKLDLPDVQGAEGNPLILFFLEREVREMNRLTRGSSNYYRKRIRLALANEATVQTVQRKVGAETVKASEIRIAPHRADPARSRYEKFAEKTFVLTLSEEVPGSVVELASELLASGQGAQAATLLRAESLTYVGRR